MKRGKRRKFALRIIAIIVVGMFIGALLLIWASMMSPGLSLTIPQLPTAGLPELHESFTANAGRYMWGDKTLTLRVFVYNHNNIEGVAGVDILVNGTKRGTAKIPVDAQSENYIDVTFTFYRSGCYLLSIGEFNHNIKIVDDFLRPL